MASPNPEPTSGVPVMFRPGKKRKMYRRRPEEEEEDAEMTMGNTAATIAAVASHATASTSITSATAADEADVNFDGISVAEALRLRDARKHRRGGVAFRAGLSSHGDGNSGVGDEGYNNHNSEQSMVLHTDHSKDAAHQHQEEEEDDSVILGGITKRFAPQTGLVGELVNRHMEEYVESELARRKRHAAEALAQKQQIETDTENMAATSQSGGLAGLPSATPGPPVESQRALQGKLMEIDLGEEARARNVEMTERARRRLLGLGADDEDEGAGERQGKTRLGPDGKPWRSKNQRNSDDIKRDQLVEEFLSENRLDVYDVQPEQSAAAVGFDNEEMAADDRIAEEFRREFMDAMSQRRRRKAVHAPKPGAKKEEEILRGPKLGGSRNARAAMRDLLLKEQEKNRRR